VPVAAELSLPNVFSLDYGEGTSGELDYPKLVTTSDEAEEAYRACYPPDELTTGKPLYRITINSRGKTTKIELVESTGLGWLDSAGRCILERLRFEPARVGKSPVDATMTIPIVLRPPK
jgi:TonB family protein